MKLKRSKELKAQECDPPAVGQAASMMTREQMMIDKK
jgi:hypothetical protein